MIKKIVAILVVFTIFISSTTFVESVTNYDKLIVNTLAMMRTNVIKKNPNFLMIINGGYNLYLPKARTKNGIFKVIDGVIIEDAFTHSDKCTMQKSLGEAIKKHKKAFSIEYKSFKGNKNVVSYKAKHNLDNIPKFKTKKYNVNNISDVKNFMAILDTHKYKSKKKLINALKRTDYDLIFIDLFDESGHMFTKADIKALKVKHNGGKRIVCSYISVGEAENYRYYWKKKWNKQRPKWIVKENKEWKGNYKVKYWDSHWQHILNGYMNKIVNVGFDGAYLDVIDAYEYFM